MNYRSDGRVLYPRHVPTRCSVILQRSVSEGQSTHEMVHFRILDIGSLLLAEDIE